MCIFGDRKKNLNNYRKIYNILSNNELQLKLEKIKNKKSRAGCFCACYTAGTIGSGVMTLVEPITGISSIPAMTVSSVAAIDALDEYNLLNKKQELIEQILKKRNEGEVYYYNNKRNITIL
jgi:hypothetical protein